MLAAINNILDFNINVVVQSALAFALKNINYSNLKIMIQNMNIIKNNNTKELKTIIRNKSNQVC